jgi:hypothetical protein
MLEWEKYFEENDQYLISSIDFGKVFDPKKQLDDQFVADYSINDDLEHKQRNSSHSPQRLVAYLSNFRSTSKSLFGKLIHGNNELYEVVISSAKRELNKLYDVTIKEKLPIEIFRAIQVFIKRLGSPEKLEAFSGKTMDDVFPEISDSVYRFNRLFRFGFETDQQGVGNFILDILKKKKEYLSKYRYLECPKNIDSRFSIMSSTRNVYAAISSIFSICEKHSNGMGAFSVRLVKKANRTILQLVDIASYTNKHPRDIQSGSGDFERLKALLWSYCDFNVYTIYDGKDYRVPLLPIDLEVETINERIDGFTFEFIFYHPLKIMLIDDGLDGDREPRIKRYELLLEENHAYGNLIESGRNTDKTIEELHRYNAIFMHSSYSRFEELKPQLMEGGIPIISFSGGKSNHFDDKHPNTLTLNVNDFYNCIPEFLRQIDEDQQVDLGKLYKLVQSKNDRPEKITAETIKKIIQDDGLSYPELSTGVYTAIKNLTKLDEVPEFKSRKELALFLEDFN